MLIGEYSHTIDAKGRINFPAKLRESLGGNFIITRGLDHCLYAYSLEEWENLTESIKSLPRSKRRNMERFFFAGAIEAQPDKQGRIIVSQNLREYASLEKNVVVVGASDRVEIWDQQAWQQSFEECTPEAIEEIMDELGF
ncbi:MULTISPECIES: division/cell wall cluster transcriptional repressor MraZ [Clostridiaceae]|uniref:Transcriptional regulator MraZ n=1 Tax=Clostridium facile TaxID=2763035 RepID=A0ABR7IQI3_9CLOT|nr:MULTISPECIES: division/cell wall cluster transcriptional repressor MraZ [Clostridiaceae]MBC5787399.1 division/cell wall cluster transcriptional repressor MraZ [Clostridium facile]